MAFSKKQLQKFADLIKIEISDKDLEKMDVDSIIDWLDKLQKIDTSGVEPMINPIEHKLFQRKDVVSVGDIRDSILKNAPDKSGVSRGYFAVPKVIEEE